MKFTNLKKIMILFAFLVVTIQIPANAQASEEIAPYVNFLNNKTSSAKEYILSLFKKNDLVILCERDHREITQYDLILDIMRDPYFINNVGVVFTEVGTCNLNPELNVFLQDNGLTEEEITQQTLKIQQNCMFPLWEKSNFTYFIKGIHEINNNLADSKKIQMYPAGIAEKITDPTVGDVTALFKAYAFRDSIMADNIITRFEKLKKESTRKKALVIMNYRHAFKNDSYNSEGQKNSNVGRFLFDKYPDKISNVMINNWCEVQTGAFFGLIQDGKWDAAFQYTKIENAGFDFKGSPFGEDKFDYWTAKNDFTYKDIFDGFVFYSPIGKYKMAKGLPGLMENGFYEIYAQRITLINEAFKKNVYPPANRDEMMQFNNIQITEMNNLDKLKENIAKWLKQ